MATTILNPDDIASTCKNCHNYRFAIVPTVTARAKMALLMVGEGRLLINAYSKLYPNLDSRISEALENAKSNFYKAVSIWHEFDLEQTSKLINRMMTA